MLFVLKNLSQKHKELPIKGYYYSAILCHFEDLYLVFHEGRFPSLHSCCIAIMKQLSRILFKSAVNFWFNLVKSKMSAGRTSTLEALQSMSDGMSTMSRYVTPCCYSSRIFNSSRALFSYWQTSF